jgi:hypothetical protein
MPGVSREVIEHTLNIKFGSKPVKQGMWRLNQEKRQAMGEELSRLLAAGFIKEIQHPDRIANLILVPKKKREVEDVCRLHEPEQGMSKRSVPPSPY